ncbi:MAG: GWxTD domain-containing protein [Candidatus Zhuqueibacterota bacterium]
MNLRCFITLACLALSLSANAQELFTNAGQQSAAFEAMLSVELKKIYQLIHAPEEKAKWEAKYWKMLDPTPHTEYNEFYDEYLRRFSFAQKHFSNIIKPLLLDDRGKYYLKYGEPDDRVSSVGLGKAYKDNETWAYYRLNLFIDFVDEFGYGYREAHSLLDAVESGPVNQKTLVAAELYSEREELHQRYQNFRDVRSSLSPGAAQTVFFQHAREMDSEKKLVLESIPPVRYDFDYGKKQLDARIASCIFRGENGRSRMELYYSLPLNQLGFEPGGQMPFETLVEKRVTFMDANFDVVAGHQETLKLAARSQQEIDKRIYINQHNENLLPGTYNFALQLDNETGGRLAILTAQVNVRDFSGDSLRMSDIQLAARISEGSSQPRNLKPNNILVVPHLGHIVNKSIPMNIYFEVYNLTLDDSGQARFSVAYEVNSVIVDKNSWASLVQFFSHLVGGDKKETIGSSFETAGMGEFQQIYLTIDFSKFPLGPSQLVVKVTDVQNGKTAVGEKRFILK